MTDKEVNYRAMARQAVQKLADYRSIWEPAAPRMVPDYEKVQGLLADFDAIGTALAGTGSQGYTDAKDLAEGKGVVAAMRVVKGLRNVQLNEYRPAAQPGFVSLEGYIAASIFVEGLRRAGPRLTTNSLVAALEEIRDLDLGIGEPIRFGPSKHQGSSKVWGSILDDKGDFRNLDLD